jgi:translation initiation factor 2B subunit (eIF-2B alpha/beta/delta family)
MESYDSRLLSHAANIAGNRISGASEIAITITTLFSNIRKETVSAEVVNESLKIIAMGQPSMAIVLRITSDLYIKNYSDDVEAVKRCAEEWLIKLERSIKTFSQIVSESIKSAGRFGFFSHSSYVNAGISALAEKGVVGEAVVGRSMPGGEGERTSKHLKESGWKTKSVDDASFFDIVSSGSLNRLILGCDGLDNRSFVNKIGSGALVRLAKLAGTPVEIWTSSHRFLPSFDSIKIAICSESIDNGDEEPISLFGKGSLEDIEIVRTELGVFSVEKVRELLLTLPSIDKSLIFI